MRWEDVAPWLHRHHVKFFLAVFAGIVLLTCVGC